jgi:hypothetical protein
MDRHNSSVNIVAECSDSDTRLWNTLIDNNKTPIQVTKKSVGNIIDDRYILGCFHGIQHYQSINVNQNKATVKSTSDELDLTILEYKATIKSTSDELDLTILEYKSLDNYNSLKTTDFNNVNLPKIGDELNIFYLNKSIKLYVDNISFENMNCFIMPKLPYIKCKIFKSSDDMISLLKGLSGSLVKNNDGVICGMLSEYNIEHDLITITPTILIKHFLHEYLNCGDYNGIVSLLVDHSMMDFEHENEQYIGATINKKYALKNNLKEDDIIIKLNDKSFNSDGTIYDNNLDQNIDLETYIAINFTKNDKINLTILREIKNKWTQKQIEHILFAIQDYKTIPINHNNKFIINNGFVFTELTENIIEFYRNHNIYIGGDVLDEYANNMYTGNKIVVLINIINNQFNQLIDIKLPLVPNNNCKNEYYLCIIDNLNNKKINNLNDLSKNINDHKNNFKLHTDNQTKLSIIMSNTNFSIKYIGNNGP